jgi:hypothetical protein
MMETDRASRPEEFTAAFRRCLIAFGISLIMTPLGAGLMRIDLPFGTPDWSEGGGTVYWLGVVALCCGAIGGAISLLGILILGLRKPEVPPPQDRRLSSPPDPEPGAQARGAGAQPAADP